ncbi:hypothetical protein [Streptomyces sp. NPDC016845]
MPPMPGTAAGEDLRGAMFEEDLLPMAVTMPASGITPPPQGL